MKNAINYYYNLSVEYIHFYQKKYYFKFNTQDYVLLPYNRTKEELMALYKLNQEVIMYDYNYHQIIINKNNIPITLIDNITYVLIKLGNNIDKKIELEDIYPLPIKVDKDTEILVRFSWPYLWSQKIDYIEYQVQHLEIEYPNLTENIWYYIGMGENAISYIRNTLLEINLQEEDKLVVAHKRIHINDDLFEYYNPLSLIIDHPTRDISEILKSYFLEDKHDLKKIEEYLETIQLSPSGYRLLFGRMLFPSFYFDLYEQAIKHEISEKEIILLNNRMIEYEDFLIDIYLILKKYTKLPEVDWITKKT